MRYTVDLESAKKGATIGGNYLDAGMHKVTIAQAYEIKASSGAVGVHIDIETETGTKGRFELWVESGAGEEYFGREKLDAIQVVTGTKDLSPTKGTIDFYDFETSSDAKKNAICLSGIMNKKMVVVLNKSAYEGSDGTGKSRIELLSPLKFDTLQNAQEILDKMEAGGWKKALDYAKLLTDKADKEIAVINGANGNGMQPQSFGSDSLGGVAETSTNEMPSFDDDDDFPF